MPSSLVRARPVTPAAASINPYQGRKRIMQKTLRIIGVSATVLMLAVGIFFQLKVFQKTKYISQLNRKLSSDYSAIMFGKEPPAQEPIHSKLKREYKRILRIKSGQSVGDENSVTARLTFIFEAINNAPKNIDLKINTISVTSKTMRIIGDTSGRKGTLALFKAIKDHPKLSVSQQNLKQSGARDTFTITLEPK